MKSTMGAALSAAEIERIYLQWDLLKEIVGALPERPDPVEMCGHLARTVGHCHGVRRVIGDAWHAANKRAFPLNKDAQRSAVRSALTDLEILGLTLDDLAQELASEAFNRARSQTK